MIVAGPPSPFSRTPLTHTVLFGMGKIELQSSVGDKSDQIGFVVVVVVCSLICVRGTCVKYLSLEVLEKSTSSDADLE